MNATLNLQPRKLAFLMNLAFDPLFEHANDLRQILADNLITDDGAYKLGAANVSPYRIDTGKASPFKSSTFRVSQKAMPQLSEHIKSMIEQDVIFETRSPWSSPIFVVSKKDGTFRPVIDFRALNGVTLKDNSPVPHIIEAIEVLRGAKWFTTLDLKSDIGKFLCIPTTASRLHFHSMVRCMRST